MTKGECISNIDDLKKWYDLNQLQAESKPYFTIWRGPESKADRIVFRNSEISDTDAAWNAMEEILEMHTEQGGLFRIFITNKPAFNVGITTLYKVANPYQQLGGHAGIQGFGAGRMYSTEEMEKELNRERRMWDLEKRIERMSEEAQAKVGEMEDMMGEFMPIIKDLAHKFGMKMMGYGPQQAPANVAPMAGHHADNTDPQEGFDYERLEPALDNLRTVFPDTETTIERLARWAQQNPAMAQQLMQNLDA